MCFDISSTKIKQLFEKNRAATFVKEFNYEPYYHATGFLYPKISIIKSGETKKIHPSIWGLVPDWGHDDLIGFRKKYNTLNAKSETLLTSNMYKDHALENRCIILVDGFFEPHRSFDTTIPYYCYIPSEKFKDGRDVLALAGIYNSINDNISCSIITTEANEYFSEIHNIKKRMPLVLDESIVEDWLDPNLSKNHIFSLMKEGFTKKEFNSHSISKSLYSRGKNHNTPSIINKVIYNTLFD